jgi:hypothetical protein
MKLNRILAVAATLALGATAFTATSATAATSGGFTYTVIDGNATITNYTGPDMAIDIPAAIFCGDGCEYPVTAIGTEAFFGKGLTSVTIPNSVSSIGQSAFDSNDLMASVTIGSSVTSIGRYAFSYTGLTSVTIPDSVTSIGGYAFSYSQLTSVTIGSSVTSIGEYAFGSNTGLTSTLFLGNAPAIVTAPGSEGSFDTTSGNLTVSFTYGATGFGTGPTWQGYTLAQPSPPEGTSLSDVTAGVTSGVRTATLDPAVFGLVPFSHGEQWVDTDATLTVDDLTGAGVGWNVTLSASALTWAAANGGPQTGIDLPSSALAVTTVGEITTVAGENWVGDTAIGALGSPVKVLSTPGGNGSYSAPLTLRLTLPSQASVGTYTGTLTTTISTAP